MIVEKIRDHAIFGVLLTHIVLMMQYASLNGSRQTTSQSQFFGTLLLIVIADIALSFWQLGIINNWFDGNKKAYFIHKVIIFVADIILYRSCVLLKTPGKTGDALSYIFFLAGCGGIMLISTGISFITFTIRRSKRDEDEEKRNHENIA